MFSFPDAQNNLIRFCDVNNQFNDSDHSHMMKNKRKKISMNEYYCVTQIDLFEEFYA
jgi:hypothetical protein